MDWVDKVKYLQQGRSLHAIGEAIGLRRNVLATTMAKGSMPSASVGVKLANVLGVKAEWLFDDSLGLDDLPASIQQRTEVALFLHHLAASLENTASRIVESCQPPRSGEEAADNLMKNLHDDLDILNKNPDQEGKRAG